MEDAAAELVLYFLFMLAAMSILSLPLAPATLLAAKVAPPWAVALIAACSAGLSAVFDHWFVRRAFQLKVLERMRSKALFQKAERWAKVAPFWTTGLFAGLPIPFTIVRILMPLSGYPVKRYAAATALGRLPRIFVIATFGTFVEIPTDVLVGLLIAGVVLAALLYGARRLGWIRSPIEADDPPESRKPKLESPS